MVSRKITAVLVIIIVFAASILTLSMIEVGTFDKNGKVKVVTTFYPIYFFTDQIVGDMASVTMLIPDNVEPHSWGPTASDMIAISNADMFVYNGGGLEPWADEFIAQLPSGAVVVDTSKNIELALSDQVESIYSMADTVLSAGPYFEANLSSPAQSSPYSEMPAEQGCYNLTLVDLPSGTGGVFWLDIASAGDYRFLMVETASLAIQYENGTSVVPESELGTVPLHGSFSKGVFVELEPGRVLISLENATEDQLQMVLVVPDANGSGEDGHEHGINDPHFWIDPLSAKIQVENILEGMIKADPVNATAYKANAQDLKDRLDALNQDFITGLANRTKNDIITTHEGFNYLANRYGFTDHAAIGISGDAQPSAQDMKRLTDLVNDLGLHYVFGEPIFRDAIIDQIASETGAQVLVLDGAHGRTGVHKGMDYFQIMYANLEALRIGLEVEGQA